MQRIGKHVEKTYYIVKFFIFVDATILVNQVILLMLIPLR